METRVDISDREQQQQQQQQSGSLPSDVTTAIGKKIAEQVLSSSTESAKSLFSTYGRIDILRPYFDVETSDVLQRLLESLRPRLARLPQAIGVDMYGPITLCLTLVAIHLLSMKSTGITATGEATLMGTSMASAFGYWFSSSGLIYCLSFIFNTNISTFEILSLCGYGLFSFCLVLLCGHLQSGQADFVGAWAVLGGLAALRMALVLRSRTADAKQGTIVGAVVLAFHMLYLLYVGYGLSK